MSISSPATAQETAKPVTFKDFVFERVLLQKNLLYKTVVPGIKQKYGLFDFYEPAGDTSPARPLIIWLHGGGFKFGKKTSGGLPLWSKTFARRGYTCASINYRLSKKHPLKNFADMVEGCADAMEDANAAISFFKQHADQFRIDTNRIILGGNSAGGIIALQTVYSSPGKMAALAHRGDSTDNAGCNPQQIAAVINYWGALFNINWLTNGHTPIVSVHGNKDRVVPYDDKKPPLYGSLAIHRRADALHIPNRLKIYEGYAHELQKHFNPIFAGPFVKKRWLDAGRFTADFLYEQLFLVKAYSNG
ncbi:MAG: alpha/beta hydrolase [Bacteroidota bacterium]